MPPDEYSALDESLVSQDALDRLREIFGREQFPIYIWGQVGRGKSFLAALVCARFTGTCQMMRYSDFVSDSIKASREGSVGRYAANGAFCEHTEAGWWKHLGEVSLLILDEIGTGVMHEWRNELLWKVLEIRKNKPLLLTGNHAPVELGERFDQRIKSRICAGTLFELSGRDLRSDGVKSRVVRVEV